MVAGAESEQSRHADVEGIVVLDDLLTTQSMDDGRLNRVGKGEDLVMGPGTAPPGQDGHPAGRIERIGRHIQFGIARANHRHGRPGDRCAFFTNPRPPA